MIQYSSINDAWGNRDINKKTLNNIEKKFIKPSVNYELKEEIKPNTPINHHEKFINEQSNCSFTEHLKTCENCKKIIAEYFAGSENTNTNDNIKTIKIFGFKLNITTDVLKVIFIIIIIIIFVLLLSMINISFKPNNSEMKYYMIPNNIATIPINGQYFTN